MYGLVFFAFSGIQWRVWKVLFLERGGLLFWNPSILLNDCWEFSGPNINQYKDIDIFVLKKTKQNPYF
jgi:hypothetical protein